MKTFALTFALVLAFGMPAGAQDPSGGTMDAITEAVTKAQVELAKQLGLVPADDEGLSPAAVEDARAPSGEETPVEASPTIDIISAEQQFWADYLASQSGEGEGAETEKSETDSGDGENESDR